MPNTPRLFHDYDRKAVRDLFAPNEPFARGSGKWGLQGIVRLQDQPGDFVFFVTFGQSVGGHDFDEGISTEGIFRWQSQPRQTFKSTAIKELIAHDEIRNNVHLFLRTSAALNGETRPYTYLGRLRLNGYDEEREQPVHIAWELMDWPIPDDVLSRMDLHLGSLKPLFEPDLAPITKSGLTEIAPPKITGRGETTRQFKGRKVRWLSDAEARAIGHGGELLAFEHEKRRLVTAGRQDLADLVDHVAVSQGDGAGYDIRSFWPDGSDRFVEVKTTRGSAGGPFEISANEVAFSEHAGDAFVLFRISSFDSDAGSGDFFEVRGPISSHWTLKTKVYQAVFGSHWGAIIALA